MRWGHFGYFGDADPTCYPTWHSQLAPLIGQPNYEASISSGCALNAAGDIPCNPEALRAAAEQQLQASGLPEWPSSQALSADVYALARNIQSEVGASTAETRVALAETTVNQAAQRGQTVSQLVLTSHSGLFGEIQGGSTGRWTSSSQDPSFLAAIIANFVLSGQSNNFTGGGNDQDGWEYQKYFPSIPNVINNYAMCCDQKGCATPVPNGCFWVGLLPGVDHYRLAVLKRYPFSYASTDGQALIQRALQAYANPGYVNGIATNRPVWPADMPVCSSDSGGDNSTDMALIPPPSDSSGADPGSDAQDPGPDRASGSPWGVFWHYATIAGAIVGLGLLGYGAYYYTRKRAAVALGRHKKPTRRRRMLSEWTEENPDSWEDTINGFAVIVRPNADLNPQRKFEGLLDDGTGFRRIFTGNTIARVKSGVEKYANKHKPVDREDVETKRVYREMKRHEVKP